MRYYEIIQETIYIPYLYEGEIGDILRMKKHQGKFFELGDNEKHGGTVYYLKKVGPRTLTPVDVSVYNAYKASKYR